MKHITKTIFTLLILFVILLAFQSASAEQLEQRICRMYKTEAYVESDSACRADFLPIGRFMINGQEKPDLDNRDFTYHQDLSLEYKFDIPDKKDGNYSIVSAKSRLVNGFELDNAIGKGAIIFQISKDGESWETVAQITNVFTVKGEVTVPIYTINQLEVQNNFYYRVMVAYKEELKGKDKEKQERCTLEAYSFQVEDPDLMNFELSFEDTPRMVMGTLKKAEDDNFSKFLDYLDSDDYHYGWSMGQFVLNGYTGLDDTDKDNLVFFKVNRETGSDNVTLWFKFGEKITDLNEISTNNGHVYRVVDSKNKTDIRFQTDEQPFHHGALIVLFTDEQGVVHGPIVYEDYLRAVMSNKAETRLTFYEEGDYEVALDYQLEPKGSRLQNFFTNTNDYSVYFTFSIRNGNAMFYVLDAVTGGELETHDSTENGFILDLANSKYLELNIVKNVMTGNGTMELDTRFNRPAKDGETFTDEGIYTITVTNKVTEKTTEKTIYVVGDGNRSYIKALDKTGNSIDELNQALLAGFLIGNDGSLIEPTPTPNVDEEPVKKSGWVTIIVLAMVIIVSSTLGRFFKKEKKDE